MHCVFVVVCVIMFMCVCAPIRLPVGVCGGYVCVIDYFVECSYPKLSVVIYSMYCGGCVVVCSTG